MFLRLKLDGSLANKLGKQHKKLVNKKTNYSVYDAVTLIEKLERYCSENSIVGTLIVTIHSEQGDQIAANIVLGHGEGIHYLTFLEQKFLEYENNRVEYDPDYEHFGTLLNRMKEVFNQESFARLNGETKSIDVPVQESKAVPSKKSHPLSKLKLPHISKKQLTFGSVTIAVIVSLAFAYQLLSQGTTNPDNKVIASDQAESVSKESLTLMLEEKRFLEALKGYPQEYPKIERSIFYLGVEGIPYLEDFLKEKEYAKGQFDLAYLKKEYAKVIEMKAEADSDDRLAQLAVAFIKTGQLGEAEKLNDSLKSEAISKLIFLAKENQAIELIKKGSVDEARAIQEQINSEKLKSYFEQYDALSSAIAEGQSTLESSDLSDESKAAVESAKTQNEDSLKQLNDNLK